MKKIIIIMMILSTIALSSCEKAAFNVGNAQLLITNMVGLDNCKNVKCISIERDGTAYYAAVTEKYEIRTFVVYRDGTIEEE